MKILRMNDKDEWVSVEKRYYNDEAELQNLLTKDVNTLPLDEIGYDTKFVTIGKEVGLQNGSLDVLAVSPQGHIALIETKLDKNPEVKRTVVGQILGYAAYLWNKSYEDVENNCFKKFLSQQKINFQGSLFDYVKEKIGDENLSETEFKDGIEKRLRLGSFTLLIVVDQANQELKDIANYLNDRTGQEIDFYVIEMQLVADNDEQFLFPRLANPPRKNVTYGEKSKSTDSYDRTPISKAEFLNSLSEQGEKLAAELLDKFENHSSVMVTWRKNGFSLKTELENKQEAGGYTNFPYLFFQASVNDGSPEQIDFGYPEEIYSKYHQTHRFAQEYVDFYRKLPAFDGKRIRQFSNLNIADLITTIEATAKKIQAGN